MCTHLAESHMRYNICIYLLILSSLLSCREGGGRSVSYPELIAHAGGSIDGHIYTNSLEALEQAINDGYRFIEFDLAFTADSVLVATHSWGEFNNQSGFSHLGDSVPTYSDFASRLLYDKYTPLTAYTIDSVFKQHPDLYLVTDKISDADILERYFNTHKERMVVEAFNYDDYVRLCEKGFFRVLYSCMADDIEVAVVKHLLLHKLFSGKKIEWLALHTSVFDNLFFRIINMFCNYDAALFTINDYSDIPDNFKHKIDMIYTDSIKP